MKKALIRKGTSLGMIVLLIGVAISVVGINIEKKSTNIEKNEITFSYAFGSGSKDVCLSNRLSDVFHSSPLIKRTLSISPVGFRNTIYGDVLDSQGEAPPYAAIIVLYQLPWPFFEYILINYAIADENGHYEVRVLPSLFRDREYLVAMFTFSGESVDGYGLHGFFPMSDIVSVGREPVEHNFEITPCYELILEGYDDDGNLVKSDDIGYNKFAVDMDDIASRAVFSVIGKEGEPEISSFCMPLSEKRKMFLQWIIPQFGNIMLEADNNGIGYCSNSTGGTVLNLNYEFAITEHSRLKSNYQLYKEEGYYISSDIINLISRADEELENANNSVKKDRARWSNLCLNTTLWTLEELEHERSLQDIELYRKGNASITVCDVDGNPLEGVGVTFNQTSHDFLFGVFDPVANVGIESYQLMKDAGVNYVTCGFYWGDIEREGKIDWDYINHSIGVLDLWEMGFKLKAHALLWLLPFNLPEYVQEMSFTQLNTTVYDHIYSLVSMYKPYIGIWNVVNEANGKAASLDLTRHQVTTLIKTAVKAIKDADPDGEILVNNGFDWYGESKFMSYSTGTDNFTLSIQQYLDLLDGEGVDYDIIGQQMYNGGCCDLFRQYRIAPAFYGPTWDTSRLSSTMDHLGDRGKPVHITEQSVSGEFESHWSEKDCGWWHHKWNPQTQADFLKEFYTVSFSKKNMEAVTWWDINDKGSFIVSGGLLDENNNPKPAYYALKEVITEWTTNGREETDGEGKIQFRGFGGEYNLTIRYNGETIYETIHIWEQQDNHYVLETSIFG